MKKSPTVPVRTSTVRLIGRYMQPLVEVGVFSAPEMNEVMSNLRHLAQKGEILPDAIPQLIDQKAAAEMLSISFSKFRELESKGVFPFKRRMIGSSVRYYNIDIQKYMLSLDESEA